MHVFDIDQHSTEHAVAMLRAMQRIPTDCRQMPPALA